MSEGEPRPRPVYEDEEFLIWRPHAGAPWRLRRVSQERWVTLAELRQLVTDEIDLGDATMTALAPPGTSSWGAA